MGNGKITMMKLSGIFVYQDAGATGVSEFTLFKQTCKADFIALEKWI